MYSNSSIIAKQSIICLGSIFSYLLLLLLTKSLQAAALPAPAIPAPAGVNTNNLMNSFKVTKKKTFYKGHDTEDLLYIYPETGGIIRVKLLTEVAPNHVERIKRLAREGFYDGMPVHRVMTGFMAQMGDPSGTGMGKSPLPNLAAEFNNQKHVRGAVSMARSEDINSANSQFFIVTKDSQFLDGQYTVFGFVIEGMEYVDQFKAGKTENNGIVEDPSIIQKVRVGSDTKD